MISAAEIAANLAIVRQRLDAADGQHVDILAVSKTFPLAVVAAARQAGLRCFGESYAQELVDKYPVSGQAGHLDDIEVHFIGHLQTNKVRSLAGRVTRVCSVDRPSLVTELAKRMPGVQVLVQVNATGETSKSGCAPAATAELVQRCVDAGLDVAGLMTVGPTDGNRARIESAFATVRGLVDQLGLAICSMGMSDDLEIAVAHGSTQVRIGSALFGRRTPYSPDAGLL